MKKRKPDFLIVLATMVAVGVLATGLVQGAMREAQMPAALAVQK